MPSSHAQFLFYFATSLSLFLLLRHKPPSSRYIKRPTRSVEILDPAYFQKPLVLAERLLLSCLVVTLALSVAWSRIYLAYHTPRQVLVGCAAGAMIAAAWFLITSWLRSNGWVSWGCDTWLGQALRLRDLVTEQDFAEPGWKEWSERRQLLSADGETAGGKSQPETKKQR